MFAIGKIIIILLAVPTSMTLHAKSQALLIGIGEYPGKMQLEGPVHDVALIGEVLMQSEHFDSNNIVELINEQATRKNILEALVSLSKTTERGDKVVLYFSGHGTSALNDDVDAGIPSNSGALVPYDIKDIRTKAELNQRLLIGKRDLRPALTQLDGAGVEVLVLVDACFSGNVVRGEKGARTLPAKFLDFSKLLPSLFQKKTIIEEPAELIEALRYPYHNVYLLAAAQEDQLAQDIPVDRIEQFPTIDSKAHGAFTDSLVKVLVGFYKDSGKQNVTSTLSDLFVATRRLMKKREFLSKPNLLPRDSVRTDAVALQEFFGQSVSIEQP